MSREYLATKLASGRATVPPRIQWWPRHGRSMGRCLGLCSISGKPRTTSLQAVRDLMHTGAQEWEVMIPSRAATGLMVEHAGLEVSLIEAALEGNASRINKIGDFLFANIEQHAKLYATTIAGFPEETFKSLMEAHVGFFAEAVRLRVGNKKSTKLDRCENKQRENTISLAAFTAEWF